MIHGALSDMTLTDGVVEWEQDETPECSILKQVISCVPSVLIFS